MICCIAVREFSPERPWIFCQRMKPKPVYGNCQNLSSINTVFRLQERQAIPQEGEQKLRERLGVSKHSKYQANKSSSSTERSKMIYKTEAGGIRFSIKKKGNAETMWTKSLLEPTSRSVCSAAWEHLNHFKRNKKVWAAHHVGSKDEQLLRL